MFAQAQVLAHSSAMLSYRPIGRMSWSFADQGSWSALFTRLISSSTPETKPSSSYEKLSLSNNPAPSVTSTDHTAEDPKNYTPSAHLPYSRADIKASINLPHTEFPAFVKNCDRAKLDQWLHEKCGFGQQLYNKQIMNDRNIKGDFLILDGPPYANGDVHAGHAVNKILKDVFGRFRSMANYRVHFVPGWDCHGLPIELKVRKQAVVDSEVNARDLIQKSDEFATLALAKQKHEFMRWGINADWARHYHTADLNYVVKEMQAFVKLYQKGYVFRDFKPVFWSPSSKTALAQAELEYVDDHVSTAVYCKFPLNTMDRKSRYALVWTTTPWTLPLNTAITYNPNLQYCYVAPSSSSEELWLVAESSISEVSSETGVHLRIHEHVPADALKNLTYFHPLQSLNDTNFVRSPIGVSRNGQRRVLPADYVSANVGTGLVHNSFEHGSDDFSVAQKFGFKVDTCFVDSDGCYTNDLPIPDLVGKPVLADGNLIAQKLLSSHIVATKPHIHSYPYDWRTKKPVIVRASKQWFMNVDQLRPRVIELLESGRVGFSSDSVKSRMMLQVQNCPNWCLSRQRIWGVPIPAFYDRNTDEPVVDENLVNSMAELIKAHGLQIWWDDKLMELLARNVGESRSISKQLKSLVPGKDIFDVWFDSGLVWYCSEAHKPVADLVLEGHDQFRGWLSSMLFTSVALQDDVPFRNVAVHGFVLDANDRKMSKSEGNVIHPSQITDEPTPLDISPRIKSSVLGIDGLRYWAARYGYNSGVTLSQEILKRVFVDLRNVRLILRFCLGSLEGFTPSDRLDMSDLTTFDLWMMRKLALFLDQCYGMYENHDLYSLVPEIDNFIEDLSAVYILAVKDRLYCDSTESLQYRSTRTVISYVLESLRGVLCPITPHLVEETCIYREPEQPGDVYSHGWPRIPISFDQTGYGDSDVDIFDKLLDLRKEVIGKAFGAESLKHNLQLFVKDLPTYTKLLRLNRCRLQSNPSGENSRISELCDFFQVASVTLSLADKDDLIAPGDPKYENESSEKEHDNLERETQKMGIKELENFWPVISYTLKPDTHAEKCVRCRKYVLVPPFDSTLSPGLCRRCDIVMKNRMSY